MTRNRALLLGASGGIGQALTKELVNRGTEVWILCRNLKKASRLLPEIPRNQMILIPELLTEDFIASTSNLFRSQKIDFNYGFQLAGSGSFQRIKSSSIKNWDKAYKDNLETTYYFTRIFLENSEVDFFELLFLGSAGTREAWPKNALYGSMKAGVEYFARSLQKEIGKNGRIWLYRPGSVNTDFFNNAPKHLPREKMIQPSELALLICDQIFNTPKGLFVPEITVLSDPQSG